MKSAAMLVAAAMAVSGIGMTAQADVSISTIRSPMLSDGTVRQVITRLTDDALAPNDMQRLVTNFPARDMRQIMSSSTYSHNYGQPLDRRIERICKTWRQKYGHDFETSRLNAALAGDFAIIPKPAHEATEARISIHATAGEPELHVSIVRDMGTWSVALPHSLTAEHLRANLLARLDQFDQKSARWPAREDDAYRDLSRHVLMAVLDVQSPVAARAIEATPAAPTAAVVKPAPASAPVVLAHRPAQEASAAHHWWQFWNW